VNVASGAHKFGSIDFEDLNWERKPYRRWPAYAQSKLANLLFTSELQRRLTAAGSDVIATAAHPGYAATNLQSHSASAGMDLFMKLGNRVFAQSLEDGALPTLYAALEDIPGDSYAGPEGVTEMRGPAKLVGRSKAAKDGAVARRLWEVSEELTGVSFPLGSGSPGAEVGAGSANGAA
jgi:NAD(P)-dependent dehydrogenase (short-subunit alcohol dehydrogenase family)